MFNRSSQRLTARPGSSHILRRHTPLTTLHQPWAKAGIKVPHVTTIQRVIARVDGDVFDTAFGAWVIAQVKPKVIAIDGKEVRGAKNGGGDRVHLMAAVDHVTGTILGQVSIGVKTNEITCFQDLLNTITNLAGVIVTMDALHTQRSHAEYLIKRGAHFIMTVKGNQRSLQRQLKELPWKDVPAGNKQSYKKHGRHGSRSVKVSPSMPASCSRTPRRLHRSSDVPAGSTARSGVLKRCTSSRPYPRQESVPPS